MGKPHPQYVLIITSQAQPQHGRWEQHGEVCSAGQASLPLVSSSSMVVLVLSEDSCQREEAGGEEGLAAREAGLGWRPGCLVIRWALWPPRLCRPNASYKPCQTLQPEETQLSRQPGQGRYKAEPVRRSLASLGMWGLRGALGSFLLRGQRRGVQKSRKTPWKPQNGRGNNTHWQEKKKERGRPSVREGGLFRGEKNHAMETAMKPEEEGHGPPCHP